MSSLRLAPRARTLLYGWYLTLPGLATVWLGFRAGGFFPGQVGLVALTAALLLVGRITLARRPFEGWSPALAVASGALAGLAVWMLASSLWSDAPARALTEFDRTLLYGLVLLLTGSAAARVGDLATVLRWAAAAFFAIALAGLVTRLLPESFTIAAGYVPERVSFPVTYWNALGIACALGAVLALHLTASGREHPLVRIAAAGALPVLAVTLYFTFSRGAIWALPVGLVVYVLLAQPRGIVAGALAAGVPAAVAVKVAYGADLLAEASYNASAAAAEEGRHVAMVVLACVLGAAALRALAVPLDKRIERIAIDPDHMKLARLVAGGGLVLALLLGALALDGPRRIADARETFFQGQAMAYDPDLRSRLTSAVDNGRIEHWRVALDASREDRLKGTGAGTYRIIWDRDRPDPPFKVVDAHSLYLETLAELGVVGLALLLVVLGTILGGALVRLPGPERHAHAALFAGGIMLALHAGIDWDWEMPVLFVWLFGAGGVVLASRTPRLGELGRTPRIVAALAVLVLAITPGLFVLSQPPLDRAVAAFVARDCATAIDASLDATERFGTRWEPWLILGYCDARVGQYELAVRAVDAARARDPDNWQIVYGQAVVHGVAGSDPRPYAELALRLNPLDPRTRDLAQALREAETAEERREIARRAPVPFE